MSTEPGDETGAYVRRVLQQTQRYSEELLAENQKLRVQVADVQGQLVEALALLERRREREASLQRALEDGERYAEQYRELEAQNTNLANLYVASYRLHGTLDRGEVLQTIQEIVTNLVGSEEIAVFETDAARSRLCLVASTGIDPAAYREIAIGSGLIGRCAQTGITFVAGDAESGQRTEAEASLTACVPFRLDGHVSGAVALFRLLPQKPRIEPLDRELFDLLATHAATALHCATLHGRAAGVVS